VSVELTLSIRWVDERRGYGPSSLRHVRLLHPWRWGLTWWVWVIVGVTGAVFVIIELAFWAACRVSARYEELAYGDRFEHYMLPRSREAIASRRNRTTALVRELRADEDLMRAILASGYRQPEFCALVSGWADRMARAAAALDNNGEAGDDVRDRPVSAGRSRATD
jgi:hypothetical protein